MGASAGLFPAWTEADWRRAAEAALKGASLDRLNSQSADGIPIEPLYAPGAGSRPLGREGAWKVMARLDHPEPAEANALALEDLAGGADGLVVVFTGAVGAYGFGLKRFDSATLQNALQGVTFDTGAAFELDLGLDGPAQALAFAALIEISGALPANASVSFGLDPFVAATHGPFPSGWAATATPFLDAAMALRAKDFGGPLLVADARAVHAAGGSEAHELAFALGASVALLRALEASGVPLDEARTRIAFRLAADADEFLSLAKFRAIRLLWARVEEACGLMPRKIRVQAESAWRMMTVRDPYVNVMRAMLAVFSAGLGGADSVTALPHTAASGCPDSFARRLARNGQLILLRESNLGFVADPAAGSGAFEALTRALCDKAWGLFQASEAAGGLPATLAGGTLQKEVAANAALLMRDVGRIKAPITGVSAHANLTEAPAAVAPGSPGPKTLATAEGALCPIRIAEPFEKLRDQSDAWFAATGARPKVYLAAIGAEPSHRRRVGFMREWLEAGGFEPLYDGETETPEEAAKRFTASGAALAGLCGDDQSYALSAPSFAAALKGAGANGVILAGRPGEAEAALRLAGVDDFAFAGSDAVSGLQGLYRRLSEQKGAAP